MDLNKWSLSSSSEEAENDEFKAPACSAGGSHINHLTSLYKSIMLASALCRHHALGLHCWKSVHFPHASKVLALNPTHIYRYILCFLTGKHIPGLRHPGVPRSWQGDSAHEILNQKAQLGLAHLIKCAGFLPVTAVFLLDCFLLCPSGKSAKEIGLKQSPAHVNFVWQLW